MIRTAPDGGSAVGIWGPDFDEPDALCADCADPIHADDIAVVEGFERFDALLCADCFEARCEADERRPSAMPDALANPPQVTSAQLAELVAWLQALIANGEPHAH